MPDRFSSRVAGFDSPAYHAFAIAPDDGAALPEVTRALYVGGGGSIAVEMASGALVTFAAVAEGTVLPIRVERVKATGTSATALLGLV